MHAHCNTPKSKACPSSAHDQQLPLGTAKTPTACTAQNTSAQPHEPPASGAGRHTQLVLVLVASDVMLSSTALLNPGAGSERHRLHVLGAWRRPRPGAAALALVAAWGAVLLPGRAAAAGALQPSQYRRVAALGLLVVMLNTRAPSLARHRPDTLPTGALLDAQLAPSSGCRLPAASSPLFTQP